MISKKRTISGKDAIKRLGGLAFGLPVGLPLLSSIEGGNAVSESPSPNIITHRKSNKPIILWMTEEGMPIAVLRNYIDKRRGGFQSTLVATPNINVIAREGMPCKGTFCINGLSGLCRATITTGKYSQLNGVTANVSAEPSGHPWLVITRRIKKVKVTKCACVQL